MSVNVIFDLIDPPVIITHPPKDMHFVVSSSSDRLTLNCTAKGEGVIYWQKDGVDIGGSRMSIVPGGNTLDIAPDEIKDTSVGMYRCIASNIAGSVMSDSTSVTVTGEYIICTHTHMHTSCLAHVCTIHTCTYMYVYIHTYTRIIMSIIVYYTITSKMCTHACILTDTL